MRLLPLLAALTMAFAFTGCNTIDRRIQRNAEVFETFSPEEQELIRQGRVAVGFTPDMVAIAWGRPDQRGVITTKEGESHVWTYITRRTLYDGRRFAGYRHNVFVDRETGQRQVIMTPVYVTAYRTVENEVGRVEFQDGRVVAVTELSR